MAMQAIGITPPGTWSSFPFPVTPQPFSVFSLLSGKSGKVSDGPQATGLQYRLGTGLWAWCWERWALSLWPINVFLARLPETIYFQSSPPESQLQILFQNFSFWDEVVSREVTRLPSCCWKTLFDSPLPSAISPLVFTVPPACIFFYRLLLNRQGAGRILGILLWGAPSRVSCLWTCPGCRRCEGTWLYGPLFWER